MITLKSELVDINCSLFLSERVIVDGHGCHTALHFGVKAKETKTEFLHCTGYLNSIHPIDLLLFLVVVRQQNFLNC